ncbi:MAG: hypothetical protein WBO45_26525, partial [Planctomycetota bacterium]
LAEADVVAAILAECHAPLRGQMDRIAASITLADGGDVRAFAELPNRLHLQSQDARFLLLGDDLHRLDGAGTVNAADRARAAALRLVLDAAAFGPLHRATSCRRLGPATFELTTRPANTRITCTLRPGTLLPAAFAFPTGTVTIVACVPTRTTWIAQELEAAPLGRCRVTLEQAGLGWKDDLFVPPPAAAAAASPPDNALRIVAPGHETRSQSAAPVVVDGKPQHWAIVRDPGDWPARAAAYRPLAEEIARQGQQLYGFPLLFTENGAAWLAAPFRQRPDGPAFAAPKSWTVRAVPAMRWLEVHPVGGDVTAKAAAGERLLRDALAAQGLVADGPVLTQPFFHLEEGEPSAAKLADPKAKVRVVVRLK